MSTHEKNVEKVSLTLPFHFQEVLVELKFPSPFVEDAIDSDSILLKPRSSLNLLRSPAKVTFASRPVRVILNGINRTTVDFHLLGQNLEEQPKSEGFIIGENDIDFEV